MKEFITTFEILMFIIITFCLGFYIGFKCYTIKVGNEIYYGYQQYEITSIVKVHTNNLCDMQIYLREIKENIK